MEHTTNSLPEVSEYDQDDPNSRHKHSQHAQQDYASPSSHRNRKSICGLPVTGGFIALVSAILVIIILAAVLGGILGSRRSHSEITGNGGPSNSSSSNSSSPGETNRPGSAQIGTGVVAIQLGSDNSNLLTYVQNPLNQIVEGIWDPGNDSAMTLGSSTRSIIATDAKQDSPIVALSYTRNATGLLTRHVIYIDDNNYLQDVLTDSHSNNQWSNGGLGATKTQTVGSSSAALAACWGDFIQAPGQGIRLYYGAASDNVVQEMGTDTSNVTWDWQYYDNWNDMDTQAGVVCNAHDPIVELFYVNSTTSNLQQAWFEYDTGPDALWEWQYGPEYQQSNPPLAADTSVAVSFDGNNTDTLTFQLQNGTVQAVTATVNYNATRFAGAWPVAAAIPASKLANWWAGNDTVFFYQDSNADIMASGWADGQETFNTSVSF
ncbi:MAG: hypothetical protein M1822_009983 [Bathelium mastoideum]|nr:MAG: hypothetical protein M1822_009983 [Bathelium mastoideum]